MNYSQKFDGAVQFAQADAAIVNAGRVNAEQILSTGLTVENGVVTGYTGTEAKVAVPDYIGTTPTTQISALQNASVIEVVLPSTLTHIDASAFSGCTALKSIDLPASIEQIGANAFSGCTALTKVVCRATSVPVTGATAFPTGLTIQVPQSALSAYQNAWGNYGTVEAIPFDGVAEAAKSATNATNAQNAETATNATNIIPDENGAVNPLGRSTGGTVGENSTALGSTATASGTASTALGYGANATNTNSIALGPNSTASGASSIALGHISTASGALSTALGFNADASGDFSIVLGWNADASGDYSTALGYNSAALGESSTALGDDATISSTDSNTMQLGSASLSTLRCKVNLTVTSDKRDKTDIKGITDALAFIERLTPVTFVSNDRVDYISDEDKKGETFRKYGMCEYDRVSHAAGTKKGERRRCGLLAQEVVEAMQSVYGTDNYANVVNDNFHDLAQKPSDVENKYTLAYANLVPFLIGAIKELNAKIKALSGAKEH